MKFVQRDLGAAAEASSGGGLRGILAEFWKLILLSCALLLVIILLFAAAAEIAAFLVTPEQESRWLRSIAPSLKAEEPATDPLRAKTAMARDVLAKLAARPEVARLDYRLIVLENSEPNAVALPGGTIGVTTGLLNSVEHEVGLAFVLGHELGHFKNRDHLRAVIRDAGRSAAVGLIFGGSGDFVAQADQWLSLGYSRTQEHDADRFGLDLVHRVYGATDGSDALFRLLAGRDSPPPWAAVLSTHPDTADRIRRLRAHAEELAKE